MSACPDCANARVLPIWGGYTVQCRGCKARLIAAGPAFHEAAMSDTLTGQYRNVLRTQFGDDWRQGHTEVKAWAETLERARAPK